MSFRKYFISILSISLCFIIHGVLAFQAGEEFQVNTYNIGNQCSPAIAMDEKGNFVIAWESDGQDGLEYGIFAQRFSKQGIALGSEFQVNSYTVGKQWAPEIAMDKKGNFVITWESHKQDGSGSGIFAQRFNKQGIALGSEFQVNIYTIGNQCYPEIALDKKGNFVIAWRSYDQDRSGDGIFAQRFNKQGIPLGFEFQVNTYTDDWQGCQAIVMDKKGNFVITWESHKQDGSGSGIFAQVFDRYGQAIDPEFQVNTHTDGDQMVPAIAMDKKGNFVITWESYGGIFAQRFNKKGKAIGSEFLVNTHPVQPMSPAIAMDEKGNFVITWESFWREDGSDMGIFAQRFNKRGKAIGSDFQVNTYTDGNQWNSAVAMNKKENFVIAWESDGQDGSWAGVFAKRFKK